MISIRLITTLFAAALLAACAGGGERRDAGEPGERTTRQAEINTQLGAGYLRRGEYRAALEKLNKALNFDEGYAPAHSTLAILYEQIGEIDKAEKHHRRAVRLAPDDANAQNNFGAFLCKAGKYREAEPYFLKAARNPFYQTPAVALVNAGTCLLKIPDRTAAERYLREAVAIDPGLRDALFELARLNYENGEALSARAFLQRYQAAGGEAPAALLLGYRIEERLGAQDLAAQYAERLRRLYPDSPQAAEVERR